MDMLFDWVILGILAYSCFRLGKSAGSRSGFHAGRHCRRRRR